VRYNNKLIIAIVLLLPAASFSSDEIAPSTTVAVTRKPASNTDDSVPVSLYIMGYKQDELTIVLTKNQKVKIPWVELKNNLTNFMMPYYLRELENKTFVEDKTTWIYLNALNSKEIKSVYSEIDLSLKITIAPKLLKAEVVSLKNTGADPSASKFYIHPNTVSGYMNFNLNESYLGSNQDQSGLGRQAVNVIHEGAINIDNVVVQSQGTIVENAPYQRGDVTLVHDDQANMVRYSLGDLNIPSAGFFDARPMMGVSANRVFSIQPEYTYAQITNYQLYMRQNGNVKIIVNGQTVQNFYKLAGKYDIRDFPVLWGVNEVEIDLAYDNGGTERFKVPAFNYSQDLLGEGKSLFSYSAGIPQTGLSSTQNRIYDSQDPTFSMSEQYGFSNKINGGGYVQGDKNLGIVGTSFSYSSALGLLSLENAFSHHYGDETSGIGTRLGYQFVKSGRNFSLMVERQGNNFYTLADPTVEDPSLYKISTSYSQSLSTTTSYTVGEVYGLSKDPSMNPNSNEVSLGLNQNLRSNIMLTSILKRDTGAFAETSISFQLSWNLTPSQTLTSAYDSSNRDIETRYDNRTSNTTDEQVGVASNSQQKQVDGAVNYVGEHVALNSNANVTNSFVSQAVTQNVSANLRTSLVFAGDTFALSSQVYDSFIIVKPEDRLKDENLLVDNDRSPDFLGTVVLPNTIPYLPTQVRISTPDLREGLTLSKELYTVVPTYKSGTALEIKSASFVAIKGTLVGIDGNPLALMSGKLVSMKDRKKEDYFFTNEAGQFFAERLAAGDYELLLFDHDQNKVIIHILKDSEGLLNYGEIKVKGNNGTHQ
jgi:outer membrane usher protein